MYAESEVSSTVFDGAYFEEHAYRIEDLEQHLVFYTKVQM